MEGCPCHRGDPSPPCAFELRFGYQAPLRESAPPAQTPENGNLPSPQEPTITTTAGHSTIVEGAPAADPVPIPHTQEQEPAQEEEVASGIVTSPPDAPQQQLNDPYAVLPRYPPNLPAEPGPSRRTRRPSKRVA